MKMKNRIQKHSSTKATPQKRNLHPTVSSGFRYVTEVLWKRTNWNDEKKKKITKFFTHIHRKTLFICLSIPVAKKFARCYFSSYPHLGHLSNEVTTCFVELFFFFVSKSHRARTNQWQICFGKFWGFLFFHSLLKMLQNDYEWITCNSGIVVASTMVL